MADYGLKVVNANGYVQIDSLYKNLCLRQKGTFTSGGAASGGGYYAATLTVASGTTPQLAVRQSSGLIVLMSTVISGGNVTYTFYCSASGITISYWLFDDPALVSASGAYGLIVRNSAGSPVFDSRLGYMRVIDFIAGSGSAPSQTTSYSASSVAVIQCQLWYVWTGSSSGNSTQQATMAAGCFSLSGSSVTLKSAIIQLLTGTGIVVNNIAQTGYGYMVLDVTNM